MDSEKACQYAEEKGRLEERAKQNEEAAEQFQGIHSRLDNLTEAGQALGSSMAQVQAGVQGLSQDHRDQNERFDGLSADHRGQRAHLQRIDLALQKKNQQVQKIINALAKSSSLVRVIQEALSDDNSPSIDELRDIFNSHKTDLEGDVAAALSDDSTSLELGGTTAHYVEDYLPRLIKERILEMKELALDPKQPTYKKVAANRFLLELESVEHDINFKSVVTFIVHSLPEVASSLESFWRGEDVGPLDDNLKDKCLILFNEDGTSALHVEYDGREDPPTRYDNDQADELYSSLLCGPLGHRSATQFQITVQGGATVSIYVSSVYKGGSLAGDMLGACFRVAARLPGVTGVLVDQGNPDDTQELNVQPQEIEEYLHRASKEEDLNLTLSKTTIIVGGGLNSSDPTSQAFLFTDAPIAFDRCLFTKDGRGAFQTAPGQQQGRRRHTYSNSLPVSAARIAEGMETGAFASLAIVGVDVSESESPGFDALCAAAQTKEWTITTRRDKINKDSHLVLSSITGFDAGCYLTDPNEDVAEEASVAPSEDDGSDSVRSAGQGNVPELQGWGGCFKDVVMPIKDWQCKMCCGWNEDPHSHCIVCSVIRPIPEEAEGIFDSPPTNPVAVNTTAVSAPISSSLSSATGSALGSTNNGAVSAAAIGTKGFVFPLLPLRMLVSVPTTANRATSSRSINPSVSPVPRAMGMAHQVPAPLPAATRALLRTQRSPKMLRSRSWPRYQSHHLPPLRTVVPLVRPLLVPPVQPQSTPRGSFSSLPP